MCVFMVIKEQDGLSIVFGLQWRSMAPRDNDYNFPSVYLNTMVHIQ